MKTNKQQGFSLIELMIVVAIIGILAAIAYPSYQENVASTHRANAQSELMGLSSALERWYTQNNHYSNAADGGADTGAPGAGLYGLDQEIARFYTITISQTDGGTADTTAAQTYTLQAAPVAGNIMANDRCGTMTINSAGVKTPANPADCWR